MRDFVLLHVNGQPHRIEGDRAFLTLSRFLRYDQRATGTKIVCEEGDCGACTVLVGRRENGELKYRAVNSCIQFLFQLDCAHVVTVEGLTKNGELTPVQDAMVRCHGAQCGYCTPGFIMAMAGMCEEDSRDARRGLTGNLCRCTGYESIIKAANEVVDQPKIAQLYDSAAIFDAIDPVEREPIEIGNFARPVELSEAIRFKAEHPDTVIVQGATDFGVWRTKRAFAPAAILSLDGIAGLSDVRVDDGMLIVGGRASLAQFEEAVRELVPALAPVMERFGSPQIKNAGTLAGNIANASPIADTLPFLYVMGASLELTGTNGSRTVAIADFYLGYKKLDLRADEIITRIFVPLPSSDDTLRLYKISKRSHLDISTFTAAMLMRRNDGRIDAMRVAYGGVGPVVLRLKRTEEFLGGRPFARETFVEAGEIARGEIAPIADVRGSKEFRLQLAENIMSRFYFECEVPPRAAQ
ncbi:MAG TPA: FAD binding domain-containing protein [Thermoanaerobaculia bacterium]|nr:FAD binding domain-containing protein [Thermoanaerobaculia bacterium]